MTEEQLAKVVTIKIAVDEIARKILKDIDDRTDELITSHGLTENDKWPIHARIVNQILSWTYKPVFSAVQSQALKPLTDSKPNKKREA